MANLQVKGVDDDFYAAIKALAAAENRSVSQQVLVILREYLAKEPAVRAARTSAEVLLDLAGSWDDDRRAGEIVDDLRRCRRPSAKLGQGL
ncbi:MAG: FitA-like ribbon-helix-helix domain-containing protein [Deferrisomatales bacterium]